MILSCNCFARPLLPWRQQYRTITKTTSLFIVWASSSNNSTQATDDNKYPREGNLRFALDNPSVTIVAARGYEVFLHQTHVVDKGVATLARTRFTINKIPIDSWWIVSIFSFIDRKPWLNKWIVQCIARDGLSCSFHFVEISLQCSSATRREQRKQQWCL